MKKYALYTCNASNHKNFITEDYHGNPFLRKIDAIDYGKNMQGTSVYLVTMSKDIELIKVQYRNITMDYKEKYEQALERAKAYHNDYTKDIVEEIFPELKESEDERIRKELITHCRNTRCVTEEGAERIAKWIAWLEKQCKKKSVDDLTQQEAMDIAVAKCFQQVEQKPVNKIEPKFNEGDGSVKIIFPNESDGGEIQICDQSFDRSMSFIFAENMMLHEFQNFLTICRIKKEIEL